MADIRSPFCNLANETLLQIFEYLPVPALIRLRSLSPRVRFLINIGRFWYDERLDFAADLYQCPPGSVRERRFLETLLDDESVRETLGGKTSWTFSSIQAFNTIAERIPQFGNTARRIVLACSDLDSLTMSRKSIPIPCPIDYDTLARFASSVVLDRVVASDVIQLGGAMHKCTNLESLELCFPGIYYVHLENEIDGNLPLALIPFGSVRTLTKFSLVECSDLPEALRGNLLDIFPNITELTVGLLNDPLHDMITTAKIKLTDLGIHACVGEPIFDMFCAPSLERLERLTVSTWTPLIEIDKPAWREYSKSILFLATFHLPLLRNIVFEGGFDLEFCRLFAGAKSLESLRLSILKDYYTDGGIELEKDFDNWDSVERRIKDEFDIVCVDMVERPVLRIDLCSENQFQPDIQRLIGTQSRG